MHALVSLSGSRQGSPFTAPAVTSVTEQRTFLAAVVVLVVVMVLLWGARPLLRRRHARLDGATPREALLMAGLGHPMPTEPLMVEPIAAIDVLPAKHQPAEGPLELDEEAQALIGMLGDEHPMSAPGRHRSTPSRSEETSSGPDAEALLTVAVDESIEEPVEEPVEEPIDESIDAVGGPAETRESAQDDVVDETFDDDAMDDEGVAVLAAHAVTEVEVLNASGGHVRASAFYGIDWQDEEWQDLELSGQRTESGSEEGEGWWLAATPEPDPEPVPEEPADEPVLIEDEFDAPVVLEIEQDEYEIEQGEYEIEQDEYEIEQDEYEIEQDEYEIEAVVPAQRTPGRLSAVQQQALVAIGDRLEAAEDRTAVARVVTEECGDLLQADSVAFVVRSPEGPRVLAIDPDGGLMWGPRTLAALIHLGAPVRQVLDGDPLADGAATALLAVPIASAGAWAGVLVARRAGNHPFTELEEGLFDRAARLAGTRLDSLTRRGAIRREEGEADEVTGLAPQSRLIHDLQAAVRTYDEHGMPVSLLVAEVEGLARMRMECDQEQADEAMSLVAGTLAAGLRVGDVPYRFSEDVLAVLLAATEPEDAAVVAGRLVEQVDAATDGAYELTRPLRLRTVVISVVGTAQEILDEAEKALTEQRVQVRWAGR